MGIESLTFRFGSLLPADPEHISCVTPLRLGAFRSVRGESFCSSVANL